MSDASRSPQSVRKGPGRRTLAPGHCSGARSRWALGTGLAVTLTLTLSGMSGRSGLTGLSHWLHMVHSARQGSTGKQAARGRRAGDGATDGYASGGAGDVRPCRLPIPISRLATRPDTQTRHPPPCRSDRHTLHSPSDPLTHSRTRSLLALLPPGAHVLTFPLIFFHPPARPPARPQIRSPLPLHSFMALQP